MISNAIRLFLVVAGLDPATPIFVHRAFLIGVAGTSPATTQLMIPSNRNSL
jgi:hypothetical protein